MEQDVDSLPDDRREKKPKAVRHDEESPGPKKDKKTRTPEEVDQKRGEIVDAYLERMVRELEKEVTADPKDFYDVKIFCRKPLKEVSRQLSPQECCRPAAQAPLADGCPLPLSPLTRQLLSFQLPSPHVAGQRSPGGCF